jgi:hypothetical protein
VDITNQPKPTQTHITDRPDEPTPDTEMAPTPIVRARTDFLGYVLLFLAVIALTALMAVIGGWPLVLLAVVVSGLGLIHYWTWGRSLSRQVADERANDFRQRLNVDANTLSEVERPRHY